MMNVSHKKKWIWRTVKVHMEQPLIPLIKVKNDDKPDKYFVEIKLRRDPVSEKSNPYEFKIAMFDNGEPEKFLFFVCNFNMTLKALEMLKYGAKAQ